MPRKLSTLYMLLAAPTRHLLASQPQCCHLTGFAPWLLLVAEAAAVAAVGVGAAGVSVEEGLPWA